MERGREGERGGYVGRLRVRREGEMEAEWMGEG